MPGGGQGGLLRPGEENHIHRDELPASQPGLPFHALFRQHRSRWRRSHPVRIVRYRQNHALRRPGSTAHRGR